ncbi:MAG: ABC transporter ATP-binding protein [Epsilonproteobacteria bacterium]|nr:ABC transporter ATP-binding protein [Campylobacterota bacterium]MBD3839855.1 ABC transporter ATP-binding protein [Campylobacterota bacterium]
MSILEIKDLNFSYEKEVILKDISLGMKEGDFLAIIGPNGGGKSTLLKLILGILTPMSGDIKLFNDSFRANLSRIGYVPQNTNINIDFPIKVIDVVLMGYTESKKKLFGYSKAEIQKAMEVLEQVGISSLAQNKIGSLSGGQRQRVMIARAICNNPKLLILDEPTASIDSMGQKQIYELLKKLNTTISIIVVSHDISVILSYASSVAYINRSLVYHQLAQYKDRVIKENEHFCEVELLEMIGGLHG